MTEREEYLTKCLQDIFEYCKEHSPYCDGCIFYRQVQIGKSVLGQCRVLDCPEVFGEAKEKPPT
jgi:hypothetical protein